MAHVKWKISKTKPGQKASIIAILYVSDSVRPEINTGEKVLPAHWSGTRVKSAPDRGEINLHLIQIETDLLQLWRGNKHLSKAELISKAREVVRGTSSEKKTLIQGVQQFIAQYEREKDPKTVKRYRVLLNKLKAFNPDLTFEQMDFNFYSTFKNWLYDNPNKTFGKGYALFPAGDGTFEIRKGEGGQAIPLFDDVVFKYLINLKTICAWADKRDYNPHQSYKSWEIISRQYPPISLTQDELHKLESVNLPKHLDIARDYLSLECRTGQRISDLKRFSKNDIKGHLWVFTQKKGNRLGSKQIMLPLTGFCAPALLIFQKYNYELPPICEQVLNRYIKTICEMAGIDTPVCVERWSGNKRIKIPGLKYEFISSHTGRKTFITMALQFMKPQTVMSITGINSYKTLKHYDGGSEIGTIESALQAMETKVNMKIA